MTNTIEKYFKVINTDSTTSKNNSNSSTNCITIYSDGGCIGNGKKNAFGGIGIYNETDKTTIAKKIVFDTFNAPVTNNVCELYAIKLAIDTYAKPSNTIKIITDSMYSVNTMTKWAKSWKKNNWTKSDKKIIQNLDLIKDIYEKTLKLNIKFVHCKSHQAEPKDKSSNLYTIWYGNFMADKLASEVMHSK